MFIYRYLKHPKQTGALCSSSNKLAHTITSNINLEKAQNIVEIGAGTGSFTKEIFKKKQEKAKFLAVEIDEKMAEKLKKKFPNLDIEINSAANLKHILKQKGINEVQSIISGIPWALLKENEQEKLLQIIYESLSDEGFFATFAYILPTLAARRFKKLLFRIFKEVKISKIVWQNFPPALVSYCKK